MADDFGKKIERFGQDVWKKTTETVGVIGKNAEIASKTRELDDLYTDIGRQYFERHTDSVTKEFPALAERAQALSKEIADLEDQILQQKGYRKCVSCGESVSQTAAFCAACGAAQPQPESAASEKRDDT